MVKYTLIAAALLPVAVHATSYYVDGDTGNDSNNGLSWLTPWKNPGHNSTMNSPGNIQYIKASAYVYPNLFLSGLTGLPIDGSHIQFIGVAGPRGARPYIVQGSAGQIGGAYWPSNLHYIDVTNIDTNNPPSLNPNGACVFIGSSGAAQTIDHVTLGQPLPDDTGINVKGFSAIGCGGEGVQAEYLDYLTVANGLVANNGSTITNASPSGISYLSFCASDTTSGYHNQILNNTVYNEYSTTGYTISSDYNGIIIDDMDNYQSAVCSHTVYLQKTLIQGNLVFGNQGKGIHIWASMAGADVTQNTDYLNCQNATICGPSDGDVDCLGASGHYSSNCNYTHNVVYATNYALRIQGLDPTTGVASANCNIEYGAGGAKSANWDSSGTFTNTNFIAVDPLLTAPSVTPAGADFRPTPSSPQPSC